MKIAKNTWRHHHLCHGLLCTMLLLFGCKEAPKPPAPTATSHPTQQSAHANTPKKQPQSPSNQRKHTSTPPPQTPRPKPSLATRSWKAYQACVQKHQSAKALLGRAHIALWYRGASAAASLTYDDAMPVQYTDIYPIQKRFGFKATYFLYTRELLQHRATDWGQSLRNWKHWRKIQADGNEIGSHSVSHPYLDQIPFADAKRELLQSQRTIRQKIPKTRCETLAYPYGHSTPRIRRYARRYYIAARQAKRGINGPNPPDMMNIKAVIPIRSTTMRQMKRWLQRSFRRHGWTVWMFHGTKGQGWEPLTLARYRQIFQLLKSHQPRLWVAPFGHVAKYIRERQHTRIRRLQAQATGLTFSLEHRLGETYQQPLTLRVLVPATWPHVRVQQGPHSTLARELRQTHSPPCLRLVALEATPNQGRLQLSPSPKAAAQ